MKKLLIIILCLPLLFSCGGGDNGLSIGDAYQGGIIFYLDGKGGGLIAAPSDQSSAAAWDAWNSSDGFSDISGADGVAIGTGSQNTLDILSGSTSPGMAADICANLTLGGYSDWFLPSKDELYKMRLNIGQGNALGLGNIGDFKEGIREKLWDKQELRDRKNIFYWSSSQYNSIGAYCQDFWSGYQAFHPKNEIYYVRAIRSF
tara:strand:+ start:435 stop:1043 length:609 start_codon:yes stop_codon:yes gene_type:complete